MSLNTDKQFAGNYVRLVNQCRELQQAFDNSTQLNNKLHDEIKIKDLIISDMAETIFQEFPTYKTKENVIKEYKYDVIVAEQNKKAADNASI